MLLHAACQNKTFKILFTDYIQQIVEGKIPDQLRIGKLIPLRKDKGIRLIVVGSLFLKIAEKVVFSRIKMSCLNKINSFQYGVGIKHGCAVITENVRKLIKTHSVVSLDFTNAYNTVKRNACLPNWVELNEFRPFLDCLLSKHTIAKYGKYNFKMGSGVPQGGALSPLLFSIAMHKVLDLLNKQFKDIKIFAYLDDVYLVIKPGFSGNINDIYKSVEQFSEPIGLKLNKSKCKILKSVDSVLGTPIHSCLTPKKQSKYT
eukprot:TRINITY_DN3245_c2_g2_i1.p1 TRINITY_DN3245_c2_g2~~TRINITY_DN3245_c2_g2_i1.p1  ORF type:complete len:259 (-),score=48.82 TRINITY_DN3245_c2_g2_i1:213-989(-)